MLNKLAHEIHENAKAIKRRRDLSGLKINKLTAIKDVGSKNNRRLWLCKCECGNETIVESTSFRCGYVKSCGCLADETRVSANTKHGFCGTRLYRIWKGMKSRCNIPSSTDYVWYGARGVSVCNEWNSFEPFKNWALENGYTEMLTIDRIDPYGSYSPQNCRWATTAQQNMNQRRNKTNAPNAE